MEDATRTPEQRRYPRVKAALQVELRMEGTTAPIRVQTTDISAGGFYVEMSITLEVGAILDVALWLPTEKIMTKARVVTRHPQFGNGYQFIKLPTEDESRISHYIESLH